MHVTVHGVNSDRGWVPVPSGLRPSTAVRNGICFTSFADTYCSLGCRFAESATGGAHLCPSGAVRDGVCFTSFAHTYLSLGFRLAAFPYGEGGSPQGLTDEVTPTGRARLRPPYLPCLFPISSRSCCISYEHGGAAALFVCSTAVSLRQTVFPEQAHAKDILTARGLIFSFFGSPASSGSAGAIAGWRKTVPPHTSARPLSAPSTRRPVPPRQAYCRPP